MGKGGGSSAPTTQTVKNTPYLASYINDAAKYAQNMYLGKSSQAPASTSQQSASGTMYVGNDGRIYDTSNANWMNQYIKNNPNSEYGKLYGMMPSSPAVQNALMGQLKPLNSSSSGTSTDGQVTNSDWPEFFPGQTYVDYSPETLNALKMITDRATNGSALNSAANQSVLDTISGNYLNGNPYIDQVINTSLNDVNKKYAEQILPGLASNFAQSGRYGSGIQQNLTADAIGQLGKEAMGVASGIRYDNYNNERQRQLQAAALAPTLSANDYYDAQQLLGVGSAREALDQAKLQDAMDRFNYYENQPSNMLDQYISRINALNGGYGTQTSTNNAKVSKPSALGNILGLGLTGLGIASGMGAFGSGGLLGGLFGGASGTSIPITSGALSGASYLL